MKRAKICTVIVLVICFILTGCADTINPNETGGASTPDSSTLTVVSDTPSGASSVDTSVSSGGNTETSITTPSADPTTPDPTTPDPTPSLPVDPASLLTEEELVKMRGQTVRVLAVGRNYLNGEGYSDQIKEAIAERNRALEEVLGVQIVVDTIPFESRQEEILAHISDPDVVYDIVMLPSNAELSIVMNYTFRPIIGVPYISFENTLFGKTVYYEYDDNGAESEENVEKVMYVASEIDPAYTEAIGVCYVNKELFEKYSADIAMLESSGGFSTLQEIVKGGYWTEEFLADMCTLFNQKAESASVFVPCDDASVFGQSYGARQVDLFFAGCDVRTTTQNGTKSAATAAFDDFYVINNYLSTMREKSNKEVYDLFFDLWASSGKTCATREDGYNKLKSGEILLTFDALSAYTAYSLQNEIEILPLPMKDHAQFKEDSPSLGYCSVLLASEEYGQIAFVRETDVNNEDRLKLVAATFSELAYLSRVSLTPTVLEKLGEEQLSVLSLCRAGLFSDVTRTWASEAGYYGLFGGIASEWSKAKSNRSLIGSWVSAHNLSLNDFAKKAPIAVW